MTIPEEPEPPEFIKWLRWGWHHVTQEGAIIRKAPLAATLLFVMAFFAARWIIDEERQGEIGGLKGTIETKDAQIAFLDQRLQILEEKTPSSSSASSRAILRVIGVTRSPTKPTEKYGWSAAIQNSGSGTGTGFVHELDQKITPDLMSKAEIDAWFDQIRIRLRKKQKNPPTSEIQANDIFFVNQPTTLDDKAVDTQVVKGPSYLYNVAMFAYRDSDTPPNKWRVTEYCSFTNNAGVQTLCDQHNRISLQD